MPRAIGLVLLVATCSACDSQAWRRLESLFGVSKWQISSRGVGPVRFGMTPEEVEAAIGRPLIRADREDDDCEMWSPAGRRGVRIAFWDRQVAVIDVESAEYRTETGLGVGSSLADLEGTLGARRIPRPANAPDYEFPVEAQLQAEPGSQRAMAFQLSSGVAVALVMGDAMLIRNCTLARRLRATGDADNIDVARLQGRALGYDSVGEGVPSQARAALTTRLGSWRLALPSQDDVNRCFSKASKGHPSWFQGDFDGDGAIDVAVQVTSYGQGGVFLVLASGQVVEAESFVGYAGAIIEPLRKGEKVSPIDGSEFVLGADALLVINCEKSAVVLWLEKGSVRKAWISD